MAIFTEVRLTLSALIFGIEIDLKALIKKYIVPFQSDLSFLQEEELEDRIKKRYQNDNPHSEICNNLEDTIDFLDFQDTFVILSKHSEYLPKEIHAEIKKYYNIFIDITPIRNRVMHTRPLLGGDFAFVYDFIVSLKKSDAIPWNITLDTRNKIAKDPSYVLTLTIPLPPSENNKVIHNLPIPDFDETGFIGRKKDADDIKRLILCNTVVSIIGTGGIGKTALAIKVAYDILDMKEKCPFDLIIWTTAKTTMLTAKGIEEINNSLKDFTGLIGSIASRIQSVETDTKKQIEEIFEFLDAFKTLLFIDNLETIQTEEVRDFIREAQMRCHIVITSRIGLGELEFPRKLEGLTENECAQLIREVARMRNSDTLTMLPQSKLIEIASKLYYNPLALKWFVNTVQTGISPNDVLSNQDNLLNFCLSNVYDKLSEGAISILNIIRAARKNLNTAEIIFLSGLQPIDVRKNINELFTTALLGREFTTKGNIEDMQYFITVFASVFLSKHHPLKADLVKQVTSKLQELNKSLSQLKQANENNEFGVNAILFRTPNEKIAAKFLAEGLQYSKNQDYISALNRVDEAKAIVPNYFETYRVSAFIKGIMEDLLGAEEDYLTGLELEPDNVRLLFYYAQLLLFEFRDAEKAYSYAEKVYTINPLHPYTIFLLARCNTHLDRHEEAINLVENLLKTNIDEKNKRIACTDLISFHSNYARTSINIENDHLKGIHLYTKALSFFELCVQSKNIDAKLIKNFCVALYSLVSNLSTTDIELVNNTKRLCIKYDMYISTSYYGDKIRNKLIDKFGTSGLECFTGNKSALRTKLIGRIQREPEDLNRPFLFVITDRERYYANKSDFFEITTLNEWTSLKDGQIVSYELGENYGGICAKNIKVLDE